MTAVPTLSSSGPVLIMVHGLVQPHGYCTTHPGECRPEFPEVCGVSSRQLPIMSPQQINNNK